MESTSNNFSNENNDDLEISNNVDRHGFLGGDQYTDPVRKRERKWIDMTSSTAAWDKMMSKNFKKVKERCRKGIPESIRAKAWQHLCGAHYIFQQRPDHALYFEQDFLHSVWPTQRISTQPGDEKVLEEIDRDLHRQFPFHEMFQAKGGHGQDDLQRVLRAWAAYRPSVGYCQAQAPVAAVLLMHMPAEQAFWCFAQVCDKFLDGYYSHGLERVRLDGEILMALLKRTSRSAYRLLKTQQVEPVFYMTEWFMCLFTRTLPWPSVLRVLDMFFCEGIKVIFKVALVLLKALLGDAADVCPSMDETLDRLKHIPPDLMDEQFLVTEIGKLSLTPSEMESENRKQLKLMQKRLKEEELQKAKRLAEVRNSEIVRTNGHRSDSASKKKSNKSNPQSTKNQPSTSTTRSNNNSVEADSRLAVDSSSR